MSVLDDPARQKARRFYLEALNSGDRQKLIHAHACAASNWNADDEHERAAAREFRARLYHKQTGM